MKASVFSRAFLLFLCLSLLAGLASCSNTGGTENTVSTNRGTAAPAQTEATTRDPVEDLPNLTYGFEDFTFLIRDETEALVDQCVTEITETSSLVDRAVFERNLNIEDRFAVNFVFVPKPYTEHSSAVSSTIKSGDNAYDVVIGAGYTVFAGIYANYFEDWNNLEHVDLDAPWWNQSARAEWATPGGKLFAMNGDLCYSTVANGFCVFFNKTVLNDAGITSPYTHVYSNTWTQESFLQSIKQANDSLVHTGTNDLKTDTFGYVTWQFNGPFHVFYSTGLSVFAKNEDGTYSIGWKNETCYNTFARYREMLLESDAAYYHNAGTPDDARNAFAAGSVVFTDDTVRCAVNFKGSGIDFGIVPYPKATEEVQNFHSMVGSGTNTFAVIRSLGSERLSRTSLILEAMACYGYMDVIPYYFDTILSYQAMQDEDSLEMLKIIRNASFFDLGGYANFGGIGYIGRLIINSPGVYGENIYTAIAVLENKAMAELDKWYALDDPK